MKRGFAAESPSASRSRFTAAFRPCSKSTKVPSFHSAPEVLARHDRPRLPHEERQDPEGLLGEKQALAASRQLARMQIQRPVAEPDNVRERRFGVMRAPLWWRTT